jgi:hypothetical protein
MNRQVSAARARILSGVSIQEQFRQLKDQVPSSLYSVVDPLRFSDSLSVQSVFLKRARPNMVVELRFQPSSEHGQDDSGLSEEAVVELGRLCSLGRQKINGFWCSLSYESNMFALVLGAESS